MEVRASIKTIDYQTNAVFNQSAKAPQQRIGAGNSIEGPDNGVLRRLRPPAYGLFPSCFPRRRFSRQISPKIGYFRVGLSTPPAATNAAKADQKRQKHCRSPAGNAADFGW